MKNCAGQGPKKEPWLVFVYCLLVAAGCLLICSKSSPLYPINDWSDANIYFSMGKGMANGRVLYRDIYDHKGPFLYGLHGLFYLVSPQSFAGVWMLEVFCAAFFLFAVWKTLALYVKKETALCALPVLAVLVYTSLSFQQGDSAEELCLPFLAWGLYVWLRQCKAGAGAPMARGTLLLQGIFCGCILWTKFTLLGLHAMWILLVFGEAGGSGQWKKAWMTLVWFVAGIGLATLPWLLYFGYHGAVLPWLKTYLYDNLFLYSASGETAGLLARGKVMVKSAWEWFGQNLQYSLLMALGMAWAAAQGQKNRKEAFSLWLLAAMAALGVFVGGKSYPYYGFVLAVFAPLGMAPLCGIVEKYLGKSLRKPGRLAAVALALCVASVAGCYGLSPNVKTSFLQPRESTMQYRIAEAMGQAPGATLLNYGFMDAGFYTAAGIVPHVKYFHQTNVPLAEMLNEQARYISEGLSDYVITRGRQPESIVENYDLIAEAESPPDFWYDKVYLYRLKALAP